MRAIFAARYGDPDVLEIREVEKPTPKDNEVLIRILATATAQPDVAFRSGQPYLSRLFVGLTAPTKIPGDVLAGVIEETGPNVSLFKVGDAVFGSSGAGMGTNAEYIVLPEDAALAIKPESVTFEEAAAISEGSLTAMPFLRDGGKLQAGQRILINGAAGGIGVYAIQLAKYLGAEVTAVCGPSNLDLVRSLGADHAIDYTQADFAKTGERYDVIFDAVSKRSFAQCRDALLPGGRYLCTVPSGGVMAAMLISAFSDKKAVLMTTGLRKPADKKKDLELFTGLIASGALRPVISRTYPLAQMAAAHRYVETGHKRGSVAITIGHVDRP